MCVLILDRVWLVNRFACMYIIPCVQALILVIR